MSQSNMKLYEVFVRGRRGLDHKHVGSLHAEDAEQQAGRRGAITRRSERAARCSPAFLAHRSFRAPMLRSSYLQLDNGIMRRPLDASLDLD